ncbi:MAG TPA: GFA family protein [Mizugakiibacter sp.]
MPKHKRATAHEGGCLCGAVRYRVSGEPRALTRCHCRSCRLASGAPSLAWAIFRTEDFALIAGKLARFASSPGVVRTFCANCGTSLTYRSAARPEAIDVTTATLDEPSRFAPTKEIWTGHALAWQPLDATLSHYPRSSRGAQ